MALASRHVSPSRSSTALSRMAPPSELACGWSNLAMIGLEIPWTRRALCAIQVVAIEPPRFCAMSRLVNALFAHFRGSMALFFHLSRIIRARDSPGPLLASVAEIIDTAGDRASVSDLLETPAMQS